MANLCSTGSQKLLEQNYNKINAFVGPYLLGVWGYKFRSGASEIHITEVFDKI